MAPEALVESLCLTCGLCCNGVLFRDVELQPGDDVRRLQAAGLPVRPRQRGPVLPQPCPALRADGRCEVYAERPKRCRDFECALLQAAAGGKVSAVQARRTIQTALQRTRRVLAGLELAGDRDASKPLARRFQLVQRRCEAGAANAEAAGALADLSQAVHALNILLSTKFYPSSGTQDPGSTPARRRSATRGAG